MEKAKIRKIAVVLKLSYASGRDLLYGISQYARQKCHWHIHVINFKGDATANELRAAVAEGKLDGIIANGADNPAIAKVLDASKCPLVVIGARPPMLARKDAIAFVHNDDIAIGRRSAWRRISGLARALSLIWFRRPQHRFQQLCSGASRTRVPLRAQRHRRRRAHIQDRRQRRVRVV